MKKIKIVSLNDSKLYNINRDIYYQYYMTYSNDFYELSITLERCLARTINGSL